MFETLRRKTIGRYLLETLIFAVFAVIFLYSYTKDVYYTAFGYASFEALRPEEIRDQLTDINLNVNFGCFGEEYESSEYPYVHNTTHLYYVIWTGDENAVDFRYMAIKVPVDYADRMEEMADLSAQGYYSEPLPLSGKISTMSEEELSFFKEYFLDAGFSEEEFQAQTLPYCLQVADKRDMNIANLLFFAAGLALLIVTLVRLIRATAGAFLRKFRQDIAATAYTESSVERDFAEADAYGRRGLLKIGNLFLYYTQDAEARAIPIKDLAWIYHAVTKHRWNFIPVAKTYRLKAYVNGNDTPFDIKLRNAAAAKKVLTAIQQRFPWVVVGYSKELAAMWEKAPRDFLDLRFNKVPHTPVAPDLTPPGAADYTPELEINDDY